VCPRKCDLCCSLRLIGRPSYTMFQTDMFFNTDYRKTQEQSAPILKKNYRLLENLTPVNLFFCFISQMYIPCENEICIVRKKVGKVNVRRGGNRFIPIALHTAIVSVHTAGILWQAELTLILFTVSNSSSISIIVCCSKPNDCCQ